MASRDTIRTVIGIVGGKYNFNDTGLITNGKKRLQVFTTLVASILVLAALAVLDIMLVHTHEHRSMILGILGGAMNIISYASPLSVMKMVIQTKSVEYMPFYLSMAIFFNTVCWTAYGLIIFDPYITIPNGVGVIFSTAQLLLYAIYYKSTQRQIEARRREEQMVLGKVVLMADSGPIVGTTL
ncbi:hypothetical protein LUZ61_015279 [Rhynchospora tenuis]|uniref:Uncharacterized protein n=1 Tax=Rhynchospora tenuis TaxID=198213 RepID=A0AAD5WCU4_9POAL|nr:hypothetical protein LUZ61_015279 [Rhynchospora tenuis]